MSGHAQQELCMGENSAGEAAVQDGPLLPAQPTCLFQ